MSSYDDGNHYATSVTAIPIGQNPIDIMLSPLHDARHHFRPPRNPFLPKRLSESHIPVRACPPQTDACLLIDSPFGPLRSFRDKRILAAARLESKGRPVVGNTIRYFGAIPLDSPLEVLR